MQVIFLTMMHFLAGFRNYLLKQQQMRWALNNKIEELSSKANNLLKNDKYGVCQNINMFISGTNSCNNSNVAKCESRLNTVNGILNNVADLRSSIDSKRKVLFHRTTP